MRKNFLFIGVLSLISIFLFQNCSGFKAEQSKADLIKKTKVFNNTNGTAQVDDPNQSNINGGKNNGTSTNIPANNGGGVHTGVPVEQEFVSWEQSVNYYCGNGVTTVLGYNLKYGVELKLVFLNPNNNAVICEVEDEKFNDDLMQSKKSKMTNLKKKCPSLATGMTKIALMKKDVPASEAISKNLFIVPKEWPTNYLTHDVEITADNKGNLSNFTKASYRLRLRNPQVQ